MKSVLTCNEAYYYGKDNRNSEQMNRIRHFEFYSIVNATGRRKKSGKIPTESCTTIHQRMRVTFVYHFLPLDLLLASMPVYQKPFPL